MKVSVFLRGVKAQIDTPAKWCQGAMGVDSHNRTVLLSDPDVCKFCTAGAAVFYRNKLRGSHNFPIEKQWVEVYLEAKELLLDFTNGMSLTEFNDSRSHSDVMKMFNEAIRQAEINEAGIY